MKNKKHIGIEIFPAEKSCEQGCSVCPLSSKDKVSTATEINGDVQETFSLIERHLYKNDVIYDMHYTSLFNLYPTLRYPELIQMSRFETSKGIRLSGAPRVFSDNIRSILEKNHIDPKIIGFSIVPSMPAVSLDDANVIAELLDEIRNWYFKSTYKKVQVTVRTNMIPLEKFEKSLPDLLQGDELFLRKIVEDRSVLTRFVKNHDKCIIDYPDAHLYGNFYEGRDKTNRIYVGNRVIGLKKVDDTLSQAIANTPRKTNGVAFAIAPKGVMLVHSSPAINNPIQWMSHKDFRDSLNKTSKTYSSKYLMIRFVRNMMLQNAVMHQIALEYKRENVKLKPEDFMIFFQEYREEFVSRLAHHKKSDGFFIF